MNVTGQFNLASGTTGATGTLSGNGFFLTKKHFITCPAHLVLLHPDIAAYRTPTGPSGGTGLSLVNAVFVDVFNVNGGGKAYTYRAQVHGIDGAGDIALLKIHKSDNPDAPKIKDCHPYMKLGDSLKYTPGNKVFTIGNLYQKDFRSVAEGIVRNNKMTSQSGTVVYEGFGTTLPYSSLIDTRTLGDGAPLYVHHYAAPDGAPIIDVTGRVVAMASVPFASVRGADGDASIVPATNFLPAGTNQAGLTQAVGDNDMTGVSSRFMRCVLRALIRAYCKDEDSSHAVSVTDAGLAVTYRTYIKGYLGVSWRVVDGVFYSLHPAVTCRQIVGLHVGLLATLGVVDSGVLANNDILSHFKCVELGNVNNQMTPGSYNWRKLPGDTVKATVRSALLGYNESHTARLTYVAFPASADYSPLNFAGVSHTAPTF